MIVEKCYVILSIVVIVIMKMGSSSEVWHTLVNMATEANDVASDRAQKELRGLGNKLMGKSRRVLYYSE